MSVIFLSTAPHFGALKRPFKLSCYDIFIGKKFVTPDKILEGITESGNIIPQMQYATNNSNLNQFMKLSLKSQPSVNNRVGVLIERLKSLENSNYTLISEVFFDGQRVCQDDVIVCNNRNIESFNLNQGWHSWIGKTSMVEKKLWNSFSNNINYYEKELQKLWSDYGKELDLQKKQNIQKRIDLLQNYVNRLYVEPEGIKIKLDRDIAYNFEVF